jgi:predicted metal-dependent hydrolase
VARNLGWLEQQFQLQAAQPQTPAAWGSGTEQLFRGTLTRIEAEADQIRFGTELIKPVGLAADLRPVLQQHLRRLARQELPARVRELSLRHGIEVGRITVRNQKTRWGSCSRRGTISLNWRLVQAPDFVRDYIILHELAHRRQLNHSAKFWQEVARLCPEYPVAENWLKQHAKLLR